jgi:hypothetical protein
MVVHGEHQAQAPDLFGQLWSTVLPGNCRGDFPGHRHAFLDERIVQRAPGQIASGDVLELKEPLSELSSAFIRPQLGKGGDDVLLRVVGPQERPYPI